MRLTSSCQCSGGWRARTRPTAEVGAELDALEATQANPPTGGAGGSGRLWWEDDPQLSPRFRRH